MGGGGGNRITEGDIQSHKFPYNFVVVTVSSFSRSLRMSTKKSQESSYT